MHIIQISDDGHIAIDEKTSSKINEKVLQQKLIGIKIVHDRIGDNSMRLFFENGSVLEATWGIGDFNSYLELDVIK